MVANPQRENGHVDLAHEIVDRFCRYRLSGEEWQVLWVIFRKTYGWHKKKDKIALSTFSKMTGLPRPTAVRALSKLITRGVIQKDNTIPKTYSLIKDYDKWRDQIKQSPRGILLSKKITPVIQKDNTAVIQKDNLLLSKKIHSKENTKEMIKETITKERAVLFLALWDLYPNKDGRKDAHRHFNASVSTAKDMQDIQKALKNYLKSDRVLKGFIKNGSTWFNNWRDWVDYTENTTYKPTQAQINTLMSIKKMEAENEERPVIECGKVDCNDVPTQAD